MKYFVFRTTTIEYCIDKFANLSGCSVAYSGYGDISTVPLDVDRYLWWYTMPIKAQIDTLVSEIENYAAQFSYIIDHIDKSKLVVAITMEQIFEVNTITSDYRLREAIERYNNVLRKLSTQHPNLKIIEFSTFSSSFTNDQLIDWKYYFISQAPINPKLSNQFAQWLSAKIDAIEFKRKKCLVLDLDNTLWGGIVGEDGVHGIKIGGDYPGNAFELFQQYILELQRQGVILAVCSKNNQSDIDKVWEDNANNLIKKEHLSAWRINWQNKAINIDEIAAELNIGLDSMVFIDDNAAERELIRTTLPDVIVPDFVKQPYQLPMLIEDIARKYFSTYSLTNEDIEKTAQYKANATRASLASTFVSLDHYIKGLDIKLQIKLVDDSSLERAAQMTQKTNQFNFTTKRYTTSNIQQLIDNGALCYTISVEDKFGDSGITGLIVLTRCHEPHAYDIDTFLMSCRVLGKGIEVEFLSNVVGRLQSAGVEKLTALYIASSKNDQVIDFYNKFGFTEHDNKSYQLDLTSFEVSYTQKYTIL